MRRWGRHHRKKDEGHQSKERESRMIFGRGFTRERGHYISKNGTDGNGRGFVCGKHQGTVKNERRRQPGSGKGGPQKGGEKNKTSNGSEYDGQRDLFRERRG